MCCASIHQLAHLLRALRSGLGTTDTNPYCTLIWTPAQEVLRATIPHPDNVTRHLQRGNDRVILAWRDRIKLGVLPASVLMSGRTHCLQRLHEVGAT